MKNKNQLSEIEKKSRKQGTSKFERITAPIIVFSGFLLSALALLLIFQAFAILCI